MSERSDRAVAMFREGASCAQAVAAAYADLFGADVETVMRAASGLGGGVGRLREVCGVVSGMALLAGLKAGSRTPGDRAGKNAANGLVRLLAEEYRRRFGSIVCRQLLGLERPAGAAPDAPPLKKRPCAEYVEAGALIVEQILLDEAGAGSGAEDGRG